MLLKLLRNILFRGLLFLSLTGFLACGLTPPGDSTSSDGDSGTDEPFNVKNVTEFTFNEDGTATLDLSDTDKANRYLVSLYSYESEIPDVYSFRLDELTKGESLSLKAPASVTQGTDDDATEDFHGMLREWEKDTADTSPLLPSKSTGAYKAATVGSTRVFKVLERTSSSSSYKFVNAELVYSTPNFYVYVDTHNVNNLDDERFDEILENFDNVVEPMRNLFGTESDVNEDDHFTILFTQEVNALGGLTGGGIITGYFLGLDLFSESSASVSNEQEIFYISIPDPKGDFGARLSENFYYSNILPAVLPHEYQHMINFNMHYLVNDGPPEQSFLSEAMSHLAEDIYSLDATGYMQKAGRENPSRVKLYLKAISDTCFTCGSSLAQRGGSYLFLRYLYEQAEKGSFSETSSGRELVANLVDTNATGIHNIVEAVYGGSGSAASNFRKLIKRFSLTVYLSNYGDEVDASYRFEGINLRKKQEDGRGTKLKGPSSKTISNFPFTGTMATSSMTFIEIDPAKISGTDGMLQLAVPEGQRIGGFIIQLYSL